jgi:uncharacterized membrane protein YbhN (UPF0104 family)
VKGKQVIQYLLIFAIGGFFLYFVFKGIAWQELRSKLSGANYYWIALGMLTGVFSHWVRAWRATALYKPLGFSVSTLRSFYAVMVGYMMNYIIPRAGELSRCAVLNKTDDLPVQKSLGTVITERIVDMVILLLLLALVFFMNVDLIMNYISGQLQSRGGNTGSGYKLILLVVLGLMAVAGWLVFKKFSTHPILLKVKTILTGFVEGLLTIRAVANPMLFVFQSIVIWLCYVLMMYFCLFAMDATASLTFMNTLVVFAIGTIGMIIPAPAAGAGTYHFAVMQSLLFFGVAEGDGIAYATLVHGVQMIVLIAIGALCSIPVFLLNKKKNA